jgi:hypothetical protein
LKVTAIDKTLHNIAERLSVFDHHHQYHEDNNNNPVSSTDSSAFFSNWDMINNAIEEHPGDSLFVPSDRQLNVWTCAIYLTVGNINLRDFELERKFADMRDKRVKEYDKKWQEALDRKDTDYLNKHACPGLAWTFWSNWTQEEKDYFSNEDRFPILKERKLANPNYRNNWELEHSNLRWYNDDGSTKTKVGDI